MAHEGLDIVSLFRPTSLLITIVSTIKTILNEMFILSNEANVLE